MIHVVEKGDTIRRIAERYGSTVTAIVEANPDLADPDRITPGQRLTVPNGDAAVAPASAPTPPPTSKPSVTTYTIAGGDTLGKVAKAFGITLSELLAANPQITNPDVVKKGQVVTIPGRDGAGAPTPMDAAPAEPAAPRSRPAGGGDRPTTKPQQRTYTLAAGDTMGKVARAFGVPLPDLVAANPQIPNPDVVKRGQVLTIPTPGEPGPAATARPSTGPSPEPPAQPPAARKRRNWPRVPVDQRMLYAMERLVDAGYPVNGAAGIIGNLYIESGIIPNRLQGSKPSTPMRARDFAGVVRDFTPEEVMRRDEEARLGPRLGGIGLAQWTFQARRDRLFAHEYDGRVLGPEILFDMDAQLDYLMTELKRSTQIRGVVTAAAVTVDDAADEILYEFERPASIISGGKRLPRSHAQVQEVFAERRAPAQRALEVWRHAHPG